jgi:hypothetical protein
LNKVEFSKIWIYVKVKESSKNMKALKNIEKLTIGSIINFIKHTTWIFTILKLIIAIVLGSISYIATKSYYEGYAVQDIQQKLQLNCMIEIIDKCKKPRFVKDEFLHKLSQYQNQKILENKIYIENEAKKAALTDFGNSGEEKAATHDHVARRIKSEIETKAVKEFCHILISEHCK